ncbi:glycosyltransferase [Paenalcaligenes hominis]|uniref:glycosyltransferase n=1 Tax=Paenalcaligenes hominis TaxID=643674 RepID=UPI003523F35B
MDSLLLHAQDLAKQSCAPFLSIPKRIAYVVSHGQSYASNGYAVRTQGIAQALNEHGFETLCFVRPGRPWSVDKTRSIQIAAEVKVKGVRYIHTRQTADSRDEIAELENDVQRYIELFKVYRPEVVIAASNYKVGLPAWVAAQRLGLPFYNEVRGFWELSKDAREPGYANTAAFKKEQERDTFVAQQAVHVFTLNQPMKDELVRRGVETNKIQLVPNGVSELPEIKPADPELQRKLGINAGDKVIGYVGSLSAYEGLDLLLDACTELVQNGEKLKLLLVGDSQPLTLKNASGASADSIANIGLKEPPPWLIQVGRVPHAQVADYYALLDTVVIPRKKLLVCELVPPMKAAEALAYRKRLVTSDVAPLAEYADKYDSVVSFETGSVKSLATTLQSLSTLSIAKPSTDLLFSAHSELIVKTLKKEANQKSAVNEPQADIIKKINESEIRKEKINGMTTYTFPVAGQRLVVEFEVVSELSYAHNQVIAGIEFKDSEGGLVESESHRLFNYSRSAQYGRYKYLSANSGGSKYTLTLEVPEAASQCVVRLGFRRGAKVSMAGESLFSFYTGSLENEIKKVLITPTECDSPEEVGQFLKRLGFNVSYVTAVIKVIETLPMTKKLVADAFWYLWYLTNDPVLFEMARQHLVFQGRMYETKQLLNEWDVSTNLKNGKNSARRVEDELSLLENGMPMPQKRSAPIYAPTGNVLYLLHNRLPYNSGGYATRTHGLLTGIVKNSNFKMHGVSRPGYPSDHAKHISKPLPKNIPKVDVVDGIEYFALDQNIRRSSLTMTEYVEAYAKEVEALAIEKNASIIHAAANFPNGLAASLAARRLGIKSVYEVRGLWEITRLSRQEGWDETDQFRFMAKMEAEACNAADAVITITEALKDLMISRGVDASKITVAPNCVHTDLFSPLEKDQKLANELGISDKDTVIGYIGSIVNYEGLDDLMEALALLIQDGITNFKFLLVGDGAVLDELKQQVINLDLQSHVIITGRIPHEMVQRYYSLVDITPFPRKPYLVCETVSPLKPFEAMASQKAVIVSSCAALTEIIQNEVTGLVFTKGSIISLKESILELIKNKDKRNEIAKYGRLWVKSNRDWKHSSKLVYNIYKNLFN